jgi:hypothetical protein
MAVICFKNCTSELFPRPLPPRHHPLVIYVSAFAFHFAKNIDNTVTKVITRLLPKGDCFVLWNIIRYVGWVAQSAQRLVKGWTVWG